MQLERGLALLNRAALQHHHVIVAVSGGADSMLLLHLACDALVAISNARLTAWYLHHHNHTLEPERDLALTAGVRHAEKSLPGRFVFLSDHADIDRIRKFLGTSWEHAASMARRRRLRLLKRRITEKSNQEPVIATGHNYSDYCETAMLRAERKIPATAMPEASEVDAETDFLRPLAFLTREQVREVARARGVSWFEDISNENLNIARNRVRKGIGGAAMQNLATPGIARDQRAFFATSLRVVKPDRELHFPRELYEQLSTAERSRVVFNAFRRLAVCVRFTRNHFSRAAKLPFSLPPFFAHYEFYGNNEVVVFRRGLAQPLRATQAQDGDCLRGDRITRAVRIKTAYGHKSVAKIFSERRYSPRQRRQTLVWMNRTNTGLAERIDFSTEVVL